MLQCPSAQCQCQCQCQVPARSSRAGGNTAVAPSRVAMGWDQRRGAGWFGAARPPCTLQGWLIKDPKNAASACKGPLFSTRYPAETATLIESSRFFSRDTLRAFTYFSHDFALGFSTQTQNSHIDDVGSLHPKVRKVRAYANGGSMPSSAAMSLTWLGTSAIF